MDSARWDGIALRDDDIIISTPAKCGTTWTQMICALLIFQDPDLPAPLTELSPWVDVETRSVDKMHAQLDAQTHRRFIKSHSPLDCIPDDPRVTYICVGRDPRDVGVSWDNHWTNSDLDSILTLRFTEGATEDLEELMGDGPPVLPEDPVERFWLWVDNDDPSASSSLRETLHHLQTFWDRRADDNIVLLHYADLKTDLEGQMRALAARLHIDVPEDKWFTLVEASQFTNMKARADTLAPQVTDNFWKGTDDFFKSGTSGQWQAFFTEADEARYDARVDVLASPDLIEWVHKGSNRAVK
jgi:hypothetical protein